MMSAKHFPVFLILIALFGATSCSFYKPSVMTAPILEEEGDLELGGSAGSTFDAYVAYSPWDHIGLKGSIGSSYSVGESYQLAGGQTQKLEFGNHNLEGAIGYYDTLQKKVYWQAYAGYGWGECGNYLDMTNLFSILDGVYGSRYQNYFLQSSLHFEVRPKLFLGMVGKLNYMDFESLGYLDVGFINIEEPRFLNNQKGVGQVALDLNYHGRKVGTFFQIQYAAPIDWDPLFTVRPIGFHLGLYFRLDRLFFPNRFSGP